jgi:hypothetical protein
VQHWVIPCANIYGTRFFTDDRESFTYADKYRSSIYIDNEGSSFLKKSDKIEQMLLEKGETNISDIKVFGIGNSLTLLYIKGQQEYLIKLYGPEDSMELFKLYTAKEATQWIEQYFIDINISYTTPVKPTYETEGAALMSEGLIQGTEKGYDPLKPLNRIEATTILVRALGLENEAVSETPEFSDIEAGSWGVRYANIAKAKGLSNGVGDGKFAPDDLVTGPQFATLLLRSKGEEFDWEQGLNLLIERGIITQEQSETMDLFTRGDMAKIIYEAKNQGLIG